MARGFTIDLPEHEVQAWRDVVSGEGGFGHNFGVYVIGEAGCSMPVVYHDRPYPLRSDRRYQELASVAGDAGEAINYDLKAAEGERIGDADVTIGAGRLACYFLYDPQAVKLSQARAKVIRHLAELSVHESAGDEASSVNDGVTAQPATRSRRRPRQPNRALDGAAFVSSRYVAASV